jgi:transcription antitermination factor NusG
MNRRQTAPQQWLIIEAEPSDDVWCSVRRLPLGTGILLLADLPPSERRRLRSLTTARALTIAEEAGGGPCWLLRR